jgi:hypothetical protein
MSLGGWCTAGIVVRMEAVPTGRARPWYVFICHSVWCVPHLGSAPSGHFTCPHMSVHMCSALYMFRGAEAAVFVCFQEACPGSYVYPAHPPYVQHLLQDWLVIRCCMSRAGASKSCWRRSELACSLVPKVLRNSREEEFLESCCARSQVAYCLDVCEGLAGPKQYAVNIKTHDLPHCQTPRICISAQHGWLCIVGEFP